MNALLKAKLVEFIKAWAMIDNIITAVFLISAILFFFGYATYSAAHKGRF